MLIIIPSGMSDPKRKGQPAKEIRINRSRTKPEIERMGSEQAFPTYARIDRLVEAD